MSAGSLHVVSAGLCCSLGYHLGAAVWALRANMDHFEESGFESRGDPIAVAGLPDNLYGAGRMARWCEFAVRDCIASSGEGASVLDAGQTLVLMLAPDPARPHADAGRARILACAALKSAGAAPDQAWRIEIVQEGRTGLGSALLRAAAALAGGEASQVLLLAGDSYLNAADISRALIHKRLFVPGNRNGFIPGEAAVALLLRPAPLHAPGLHVRGVGMDQEAGRHDGSVPSRGQGLTRAIRAACGMAGATPDALAFRISDHNGEQFFANEATNAITRVMAGTTGDMHHLTLADKLGEVGAAAGAAMLAWLWADMGDAAFSPGRTGLVHLAGDDGARCAVVLNYVEEQ